MRLKGLSAAIAKACSKADDILATYASGAPSVKNDGAAVGSIVGIGSQNGTRSAASQGTTPGGIRGTTKTGDAAFSDEVSECKIDMDGAAILYLS